MNSVAMMLMLLDQKDDFEAIFVDHGTDWPETYEYFDMFQGWLKDRGHRQITVLRPTETAYGEAFQNLYDYAFAYSMVPRRRPRWCTAKFKLKPIVTYVEKPCFMMIGIDSGEINRAEISYEDGIENRWPLIENEINRAGCEEIIKAHGLPIPMKSGCYICPFQKKSQWISLRKNHPCLFKKAVELENKNNKYRALKNKKPTSLKTIA